MIVLTWWSRLLSYIILFYEITFLFNSFLNWTAIALRLELFSRLRMLKVQSMLEPNFYWVLQLLRFAIIFIYTCMSHNTCVWQISVFTIIILFFCFFLFPIIILVWISLRDSCHVILTCSLFADTLECLTIVHSVENCLFVIRT